ncbi:MAG: hypothetical protein AB1449_13680 [Chloroflexota bacterium]
MPTSATLWRNTALMTALQAILWVLYLAALALVRQVPIVGGVLLASAVALGLGLLPGQYAHRLIYRGTTIVAARPSRLIPASSLAFPALFVFVGALFAYEEWRRATVIRELSLQIPRHGVFLFLDLTSAALGLVFVAMNVKTLISQKRTQR